MHRLILLAGVLLTVGCSGNIVGPFAYRPPQRVDDPLLTISEQQRRGRDRLAFPDESPISNDNLAPRILVSPAWPN